MEEAERLNRRVIQLEGKLATADQRNQQIKLANATAYDELQNNLEKILGKVEVLEL
jgi:hypothetical protein